MKIAFCGGGSGGHLFPAIAILQELRQTEPQTQGIFLTSQREIEASLLNQHQLEQFQLNTVSGTAIKTSPFRSLKMLWKAWSQAQEILKEFQPDIVIGCGGYASVPGILAARSLNIPRLLIEQNVVPGRATSWLSRIVCGVCVSYAETLDLLPGTACGVWTGNPVRKEISDLHSPQTALKELKKQLLVLGGSQGARALNKALVEMTPQISPLLQDWHIIHQTGSTESIKQIKSVYDRENLSAEVVPFIENIATVFKNTGIAISRAGATSLSEMACAELASILVPYPNSVRDHQIKNAQWYADRQAAILVKQNQTGFTQQLTEELTLLLADSSRSGQLQKSIRTLALPHAAANVVKMIKKRLSH